MFFAESVPLSFFGYDMQKHRFFFQQFFRLFQSRRHFVRFVAVRNAEIGKIKTFQKADARFPFFYRFYVRFVRFSAGAHVLRGTDIVQNFVHAAHRGRNGHAVIVQDNQNLRIQDFQRVERLVNQPVIERAVADKRDDGKILFLQIARFRDADRRGNRRSGVPGIVEIERTFRTLGKA